MLLWLRRAAALGAVQSALNGSTPPPTNLSPCLQIPRVSRLDLVVSEASRLCCCWLLGPGCCYWTVYRPLLLLLPTTTTVLLSAGLCSVHVSPAGGGPPPPALRARGPQASKQERCCLASSCPLPAAQQDAMAALGEACSTPTTHSSLPRHRCMALSLASSPSAFFLQGRQAGQHAAGRRGHPHRQALRLPGNGGRHCCTALRGPARPCCAPVLVGACMPALCFQQPAASSAAGPVLTPARLARLPPRPRFRLQFAKYWGRPRLTRMQTHLVSEPQPAAAVAWAERRSDHAPMCCSPMRRRLLLSPCTGNCGLHGSGAH